MSSNEQADAYLEEAELTLQSARIIYDASSDDTGMWAQAVKNAYDAIEQAVSASIAAQDQAIPHRHPAKINTFIDLYEPDEHIEEQLLHWLQRRSDSQYVDIRGDRINVPHEQFSQEDAERILEDAETVLEYVKQHVF